MDYFLVGLLVLIYLLFSYFSAAFSTSSKSKVESLLGTGSRMAVSIGDRIDDPDRFENYLTAERIFLALFIGVYSGVAITENVPFLKERIFADDPWVELLVVLIDAVVIFIIYSVGNRIADSKIYRHPEKALVRLYPMANSIYYLLIPVAFLLLEAGRLVSYLFGLNRSGSRAATQEDIIDMLEESSQQGVIDEQESEMIKDVFDFSDVKVTELMTPRKDVVEIDISYDLPRIISVIEKENYSKYPVVDEDLDHIVGIVSVKDILKMAIGGRKFDLKEIVDEPLYIPENLQAGKLLCAFKKKKQKFGIVVDEYGSMEGVVTLHDLTESVFGDILDEDDEEEQDIVQQRDGSYVVSGTMIFSEFMEYMQIEDYEDLRNKDFTTVGGLANYLVGEIPHKGAEFEYRNLKMKVIRMDGRRVDKVLVRRLSMDEEQEN